MKYVFVLGRNPLLSEAEIFSYFEKEGIEIRNSRMESNALLIEVEKGLNLNQLINELGGTIAVGKVLISGERDKAIREIREKVIYMGKDNKVVYSVLDFTDGKSFDSVLDAVKENFKNERLKARYKGVGGTIKLQSGDVVHGSPEKIMLRDMNYFVFGGEELSFGCLEAHYDTADAEKKDMEKPYRRESLAISPRLARILINLSQVKKDEMLLDPFCGIGVILGEALVKGINVTGVEIDSLAVENARRNMGWLRNNYKITCKSSIILDDSRKVKVEGINGIATEPSLGELLKKIPSRENAEDMAIKFENLMIDVLGNLKKGLKKGSKIAFTLPLIKSHSGKVSCDIEGIAASTGLRIHKMRGSDIEFPIEEFRRDQIVGRQIAVLVA